MKKALILIIAIIIVTMNNPLWARCSTKLLGSYKCPANTFIHPKHPDSDSGRSYTYIEIYKTANNDYAFFWEDDGDYMSNDESVAWSFDRADGRTNSQADLYYASLRCDQYIMTVNVEVPLSSNKLEMRLTRYGKNSLVVSNTFKDGSTAPSSKTCTKM